MAEEASAVVTPRAAAVAFPVAWGTGSESSAHKKVQKDDVLSVQHVHYFAGTAAYMLHLKGIHII